MEVKTGQTAATWWKLRGLCVGRERYVTNHVTRMGPEMAPEWPRLGDDGYHVEIDAFPPVRVDWPMGWRRGHFLRGRDDHDGGSPLVQAAAVARPPTGWATCSSPVSRLTARNVIIPMVNSHKPNTAAGIQNPTTPFHANGPILKNGMNDDELMPIAIQMLK